MCFPSGARLLSNKLGCANGPYPFYCEYVVSELENNPAFGKTKTDRANYWLDNGAQPSDTVRSLLRKAGVLKARHESRLGRKLQSGAVPVGENKSEA